MTAAIYDNLLSEISALYARHDALRRFCPLPDTLARQEVIASQRRVSAVLQAETRLISQNYKPVQEALISASAHMHWREVYRPDGSDSEGLCYRFMDKLGVYAIIGETGPFASDEMSVYLVYMPAGLTYPWHYHPAEELYFILSGEGVFRREGCDDRTVREGDVVIHESNQAHEMQTYDSPLLSVAVWRNHLDIPPTLIRR